jgi:lysophospholipase
MGTMPPDSPDRRRSLPPGAEHGAWRADDGWAVRTVDWRREGARASLLFVGGRADFIEKYAEALWHWVADERLSVSAFDWRGQGGSGRIGGDAHRGHADGFGRWLSDLDGLLARFLAEHPGPHVVVAHSMGAHLLLRHQAAGGRAPDRMALLAPMLGIRTPLAPAA